MKPGVFISVEGGEGVGKSSFCQHFAETLLKQSLNHRSISLLQTREPGGSPAADQIRQIFTMPAEELKPLTELFLVSAARCQHVNLKIKPAINAGQWVLCDRFSDSSHVYQGAIGGIDSSIIAKMMEWATGGLMPQVTFLLDCDPEVSAARLQKRGQHGQDGAMRYDMAGMDMRKSMREAYLDLARKWSDRIEVLDASQAQEDLVQLAMAVLKKRGLLS